MNGYDFDKTIYKKDSSIEFYFYLIKTNPFLIYYLFGFIIYFILYKLKIKTKVQAKEKMFSIFKKIDNIDSIVLEFWKNKKLNDWYLKQKKDNDIVISASPYFLLKPFCDKNNIKNLIATNVDKNTGKLIDTNCFGIEKKIKYTKKYNFILDSFYSDSLSDIFMLDVANKLVIVKNGKIKKEIFK